LVLEVTRSRRGWIEVLADILNEADIESGVNKTTIVYRANLNFKRFKRYFVFLVGRGLIEEISLNNNHVHYKTTEKGREFLKRYNDLKGLV
jgi:predicted transcriptional regulator